MITIMDYDLQSNPTIGAGPSSPLNDSCAPMGARFGSAFSATDAWTAAGIPRNQILLGVPAYGHSHVVPPTQISNPSVAHLSYPPFNLDLEQVGDSWSGDGVVDVCGNVKGPDGTYTYWGLMQQGFLNTNGSVKDGIEYRFDGCSMTVCVFIYLFTNLITQNLNFAVLFSPIFTNRARTFLFPMTTLFRSLSRAPSLTQLA
jgi:chitinase